METCIYCHTSVGSFVWQAIVLLWGSSILQMSANSVMFNPFKKKKNLFMELNPCFQTQCPPFSKESVINIPMHTLLHLFTVNIKYENDHYRLILIQLLNNGWKIQIESDSPTVLRFTGWILQSIHLQTKSRWADNVHPFSKRQPAYLLQPTKSHNPLCTWQCI